MAKEKFQSVRGMYDITPDKQLLFRYVVDTFRKLADEAGYLGIETPLVEDTGLFVRGVGTGTDVVDKEIYNFEDRSGKSIALRPEPTAGIVRAYIEHGMASLPQPVKLTTVGPMFRYDRPQAGRQRQFWQLDVEMFGEKSPSADAQVIVLADRLFKAIGLKDVVLNINSIGDLESRRKYRDVLVDYLQSRAEELDDVDKERMVSNPLRVLDSKSPKTAKVLENVPQILNYLSPDSEDHFRDVLDYLDALNIKYELNPLLVRGLDYYTDTVFEFVGAREGQQSSLGGGGRYDGLVELLGGKPTPAVGFGLGIERIILELEAAKITAPETKPVKVYVASLGKEARITGFGIIEKLLDAGIGTVGSVDKDNVATQLSRASKLGVDYAVIIGDKELKAGEVTLRNMAGGQQEKILISKIVPELSKRLKTSK